MVSFKEPALLALFSILFLLLDLRPVVGNPLTKLQFVQLVKRIEDKLIKFYPSDDADDYADILHSGTLTKRNATVYHQGNIKKPVFICGYRQEKPKIHVLRRGEDYLPQKDRNNYVVLRQMGDGEKYSIHIAHVDNLINIKDSEVTFDDARVFQQKKLGRMLDELGDIEVQARSIRSKRPRCSWLGTWLFCDSKKTIKPIRVRGPRKPLDEVAEAPKKPPGFSDEAGGGGGAAKSKRQIVVHQQPARKSSPPPPSASASGGGRSGYKSSPPTPAPPQSPPPAQIAPVQQVVADLGDGISEEDQKVVFKPEEKVVPEPIAPAAVSAQEENVRNENTESGGSGQSILVPVKAPAAEKESGGGGEPAPKKKHKKKHKKSKKSENN